MELKLNLVDLCITVRTDNAMRLWAWLFASSNDFALTCRDSVCRWPMRECDVCAVRGACAWYLVFGQKLAADPAALKRHQKPPLPFMFSFPEPDKANGKTSELKCGLVVIGSAIPYLEMLLRGFAELLSKDFCPVDASVTQIGTRDYQGVEQLSGSGSKSILDNLAVLSAEGLLESRPWQCNSLEIRLLSPLRLLVDGRPLSMFDFSRFARSVMRRVSSLAYYYGESESDCDFKDLSGQADAIIGVEDHFSRNTDKKMSGINGYGRFCGDFNGLMPFLVTGMYLHVGKAAAFGMGRYEIVPDESLE